MLSSQASFHDEAKIFPNPSVLVWISVLFPSVQTPASAVPSERSFHTGFTLLPFSRGGMEINLQVGTNPALLLRQKPEASIEHHHGGSVACSPEP